MWIKGFPPVSKRYNNPAASWSWAAWLKCSVKYAAATCGGAVAGCAVSGPLYGKCVAGSCVAAGAGSMIGCALDQLW